MHISISKLTSTGSDNGLSPGRRQAINSANAGILLIGPLRTNLSEILITIYLFSFKKMSSEKWWPSCLGLNVLMGVSRNPGVLGSWCQLKAVNSLIPGRCDNNFENIIFKLNIQTSSLSTHSEIALRWIPQNLTNEKSTLVQVMACCLTAPCHYLNQCWLDWFKGVVR